MKKNDFIELLYDIAVELYREVEVMHTIAIDHDNIDFGHVADYWRGESEAVEALRLGVLNDLIPFLRGIQEKGGEEE